MRKLVMFLIVVFALSSMAQSAEARHRHYGGKTANVIKTLHKVEKGKQPAPAPKPKMLPAPKRVEQVCRRDANITDAAGDIRFKICEGKKALAEASAEMWTTVTKQKVCRKVGKGRKAREVCGMKNLSVTHRTIALAAMEVATGKIKTVTVEDGDASSVSGFAVKRRSRDGVDSEFDVRSPPGWIVVALKYPLVMKVKGGLAKVGAIYTPYSRELRNKFPELVTYGDSYLNVLIMSARQRITDSCVDVAVVPDHVLKTLIFIEHFSQEEYDTDDEVTEEVYRVLITLGANASEAYLYSVSSANARGIGQIIPATWERLVKRFPKLMESDFYLGTRIHSDSMIAQILLARADLDYLFSQTGFRDGAVQAGFLAKEVGKYFGEYLAVAYNGGAPRAHRYERGQRTGILPRQSALYVKKFDQVWRIWDRVYHN